MIVVNIFYELQLMHSIIKRQKGQFIVLVHQGILVEIIHKNNILQNIFKQFVCQD